jgi:hypothetical protein
MRTKILFLLFLITIQNNLLLLKIDSKSINIIKIYKTNQTQQLYNSIQENTHDRINFTIFLKKNKLFGQIANPLVLSSEHEHFQKDSIGNHFFLLESYTELILSDYILKNLKNIIFDFGKFNHVNLTKQNFEKVPLDIDDVKSKLYTFQNVGPDKIALTFLSSGYLSTQEQKFVFDCQKNIDYIKTVTPLKENIHLLNIYGVFEPSLEEGASKPPSIIRKTNLDCSYNTNNIDRLLVCNSAKVIALSRYAPSSEMKIVLVNDEKYGGSGSAVVGVSYNGKEMLNGIIKLFKNKL